MAAMDGGPCDARTLLARLREDARGGGEERAFNVDAPTLFAALSEGRGGQHADLQKRIWFDN